MICRHCDTDVERDELAGHLVGVHGLRLCVLCSRRGRVTEVDSGHCCAVCRVRLDDQLADIVRLAADAAAHVEPSTGAGMPGVSVPASRPPLDVDAIEPELILVRLQPDDPTSEEPILWVLESWCRLLRDERGFARYGPASAAHGSTTSSAVLTDVVRFLRGQLEYATTEPTFALEQFADEIALCWRALLRYDAEREGALTWRVECPADIHGHTCGKGLRISGDDLEGTGANERHVRCPKCGTDWTARRLMLVAAETTDGHMWLDAESITQRMGITRSTLDRWVKEGRIGKSHGRYDARPILVWQKEVGA